MTICRFKIIILLILQEVETEEDAQMETHQIGQMEKSGNHLHKCLECDYSTSHAGNMKRHKNNHNQNGKFKCSSCSFSAKTRAPIVFHLKYGHNQNLKSAQIQVYYDLFKTISYILT